MQQPWSPLLKIEFGTFPPALDAKNVSLFWAISTKRNHRNAQGLDFKTKMNIC
jgi:hypothetical protein